MTRRGWVAAIAGSTTVTALTATAQEAGAGDNSQTLLKQARDQLQRDFEALRTVKIPVETEPAFVFRA